VIGFYIHVNQTPIAYVSALNVTHKVNPHGKMDIYDVQGEGRSFRVKHIRTDGWKKLLMLILKRLEKEDGDSNEKA